MWRNVQQRSAAPSPKGRLVVVDSGNGGTGQSLPAGSIHVSMSTLSVALSERLWRMHKERGQTARSGGGGKAFHRRHRPPRDDQPLLDAIGQKTFVISEKPAAANLVKLSGNFLIAATIERPGEAIALARSLCRNPDRHALFGPGLQNLWRDHSGRKL